MSALCRECGTYIDDGDFCSADCRAKGEKPMSCESCKKYLPCPFCGGEADLSIGEMGDGSPWEYIECIECGATSEVEMWNKRKALDSIPEPVEEERICSNCVHFNNGKGMPEYCLTCSSNWKPVPK